MSISTYTVYKAATHASEEKLEVGKHRSELFLVYPKPVIKNAVFA
jgi:hypothetical protein